MTWNNIHMPRRNRPADDPKMVGFWKIGRTLGQGAQGRVRIARHAKTGRYAAIKIVSKTAFEPGMSLHKLPDYMDQKLVAIDREIVVMKLIDHPNIMRLYDVWETSTELYLILEYIQGGELFDYICNKGKLPTSEALDYFQQIIAAIDYCHRFNISHRDLKPENILLDQDLNIKIADFGLAAWQTNADDKMLRTACGSPHYAAPEIITCQAYNGAAADIWSCGVILFVLLAGKLPFDDQNNETLTTKVKKGKFDMPSDIHPLAQDLIWKMLRTDCDKRITMSGILSHPFFVSRKPKPVDYVLPDLDNIAHPIDSLAAIDPDIFANLRTLWHGTADAEIIESLRNDEQNWQKGIYHLLVEYRIKHLENYEEEEAELSQIRLRRKKHKLAKAAASKQAQEQWRSFSKDGDLRPSPSSMPPRDGPPTPRRAKRNVTMSPSPSEEPVADGYGTKVNAPVFTLHSPSPPSSSPISPIWDAFNLPLLTVPEQPDQKNQAFFNQIVDRLNAMQLGDGLPDGEMDNFFDPRSPKQDLFGLGSSNIAIRPLSIRRRPGQRSIIDTSMSDKENLDGEDYLIIDNTGNVMKKPLRKGNRQKAGLGEKGPMESLRKVFKKLRRERNLDILGDNHYHCT